MEGLTRLVSESMARHGFDRPLDYRRLHWSRWFRCESHHSLLFVPSKPGVFALAEEIMDLAPADAHVETAASAVLPVPALSMSKGRSAADPSDQTLFSPSTNQKSHVEERRFSAASSVLQNTAASAAVGIAPDLARRLLAVTHFFDADDMAFTLDRMLTRNNPLRARLTSGRYFVRFVAIEDETQRRSIATALNQWIANAGEKASGIGAHFATSLELSPLVASADAHVEANRVATAASSVPPALSLSNGRPRSGAAPSTPADTPSSSPTAPQLDSGAATNIHCPSPFPSGF